MNKIKILGVGVSCLSTYDETFHELDKILKEEKPHYITVNNVHTVTEAVLQNDYKEILNNSTLSLPDGKPLSIIGKLKGDKNISRIFGPSFLEYTLQKTNTLNYSHFFFGSDNDTLQLLKNKLATEYPSVNIAGMVSPPFREFTDAEDDEFVRLINESKADIIWIGLGAPKQERWMYRNYSKLNKGTMIGIGAGFKYLSGGTKHAPDWMKNSSLEWLYRLIQEPKRLWRRYFITNSLFIIFVTLELLHLKKFTR